MKNIFGLIDKEEWISYSSSRSSNTQLKRLYRKRRIAEACMVVIFLLFIIIPLAMPFLVDGFDIISKTNVINFDSYKNYTVPCYILLIIWLVYEIYSYYKSNAMIEEAEVDFMKKYIEKSLKVKETEESNFLYENTIRDYLNILTIQYNKNNRFIETHKYTIDRLYDSLYYNLFLVKLTIQQIYADNTIKNAVDLLYENNGKFTGCFNGYAIIIPLCKFGVDANYESKDFQPNNNGLRIYSGIEDEYVQKLDEIYEKYNVPFQLTNIDGNVIIFTKEPIKPKEISKKKMSNILFNDFLTIKYMIEIAKIVM